MAMEKLKTAARDAQPRVINMEHSMLSPAYVSSQPGNHSPWSSPSQPRPYRKSFALRQPYPDFKVIVLDDDVNTFQHVVESLVRHLPGMLPDRAWELAHRIDSEGSAIVWSGPQEQAEHYHQLLGAEGLSMAPLEPA